MSIIDYEDKKLMVHSSVFLAPGSLVIGEVTIEEGTGSGTAQSSGKTMIP